MGGIGADILLYQPMRILVLECKHAASGVLDDKDFFGAEELFADDDAAECIFGASTRIADYMSITLDMSVLCQQDIVKGTYQVNTECCEGFDPCIHACYCGENERLTEVNSRALRCNLGRRSESP